MIKLLLTYIKASQPSTLFDSHVSFLQWNVFFWYYTYTYIYIFKHWFNWNVRDRERQRSICWQASDMWVMAMAVPGWYWSAEWVVASQCEPSWQLMSRHICRKLDRKWRTRYSDTGYRIHRGHLNSWPAIPSATSEFVKHPFIHRQYN